MSGRAQVVEPGGAIEKAIQELSGLIEDLNDGPWGATADPQQGIQNVIDFTLKPALARRYGSVFPSTTYPGKWAYSVRHGSGGDYSQADSEKEGWAKVQRALEVHGPPEYAPRKGDR